MPQFASFLTHHALYQKLIKKIVLNLKSILNQIVTLKIGIGSNHEKPKDSYTPTEQSQIRFGHLLKTVWIVSPTNLI